jgi:hypothetical protein
MNRRDALYTFTLALHTIRTHRRRRERGSAEANIEEKREEQQVSGAAGGAQTHSPGVSLTYFESRQ